MHRYMRHLDDLAGLDIVMARKQMTVSQSVSALSRVSAVLRVIWARLTRRHTAGRSTLSVDRP